MDDVITFVEAAETAELAALATLAEVLYGIGWFDAHDYEYPAIEHPILVTLIETARRRHWATLEARRAEAEREPEVPGWLRNAQGPPELEGKKGIGL